MPEFTPTHDMLIKYKDKGKEDWEIYAWCVRDATAKAGRFTKIEAPSYKERTDYYSFMKGKIDTITVKGKVFRYDTTGNHKYKTN